MLISCLRDNIRSPDRKQLTSGLLELRSTLLNAGVPLNSLQVVLFSFQDAVSRFRVNTHRLFPVITLLSAYWEFRVERHSSHGRVKLSALCVGEEGVEATAGETPLDVCSGQSAETGSAGRHHCAPTR